MAEELEHDAAYIEDCRVAAWCERPLSELNRYWDAAARRFAFPDGWPDGVEPERYVQNTITAATLPIPEPPATSHSGSASPLVRRLREMLR